jgi:hypothetical protein
MQPLREVVMLGPSRGLTHEETTVFIAELQQRWREVEGEERERLAWALSVWLKLATGIDGRPVGDRERIADEGDAVPQDADDF